MQFVFIGRSVDELVIYIVRDILNVKLRQVIVYLILLGCIPVNVPMSLWVFPEGAVNLRESSVILVLELNRFLIARVSAQILIKVKLDRADVQCTNEADGEEAMCPVTKYVNPFV